MSDLNDPRVFFTAERTLLAWTRTGIALMGLGFLGGYLLHFAGYACAIQFGGAIPVRAQNAKAD
jgi:uncharacterized membrane protein YidH (DUF202 family)